MKLEKLRNTSTIKTFIDTEVIITDGEQMGNEMYIILNGTVGVYKQYNTPGAIKLTELGPGSFFGEMTLFLNKARAATVVAQGTVVLMVINRENAYNFFETETDMTYNLIRTLCRRLDEANTQLAHYRVGGTPPPPATGAATASAAAAGVATGVPAVGVSAAGVSATSAPAAGVPAGLAGLFPPGHKGYTQGLPGAQTTLMYDKSFDCPLCGKAFRAPSVRVSKLKVIEREKDFRVRYEGLDTTYHEIITCTHCAFTTFEANIKDPIPARFDINKKEIAPYTAHIKSSGDASRTITDVFAGYYLALKCASLFYAKAEVITAKIYMRLMWLYEDCGDDEMAHIYRQNAHEAYITVFKETEISQDASQQICVMIGELSLRLDDIENAKTFFLNARMNRSGSAQLISQAEDGINEIKRREAGDK